MNILNNFNNFTLMIFAVIFTYGVTALGSLLVLFFKTVNKKVFDFLIGFGAGVMISASFFSLIMPAIDISKELGASIFLIPTIAFFTGGLFIVGSDIFLNRVCVKFKGKNSSSLKRCILLIVSITLHNIPEGLAVGVAFGSVEVGLPGATVIGALLLALGIGLQNFPEGSAISLPLRAEGFSRKKSFFFGQLSGMVEPIAGIIGFVAVYFIKQILPFMLCFSAGAMIAVVSSELLPESAKENKNLSTLGVIFGFFIMMFLDLALS